MNAEKCETVKYSMMSCIEYVMKYSYNTYKTRSKTQSKTETETDTQIKSENVIVSRSQSREAMTRPISNVRGLEIISGKIISVGTKNQKKTPSSTRNSKVLMIFQKNNLIVK